MYCFSFKKYQKSDSGQALTEQKKQTTRTGSGYAANFAKTDGQEMGLPMAWWPALKVISQYGLRNKCFLTPGVVLYVRRYVSGCVELVVCVDVWCGAPWS